MRCDYMLPISKLFPKTNSYSQKQCCKMQLRLLFMLSILSICSARPNESAVAPKAPADIDVQNMITVPPNCRPGQQWVNGQCRDVWRGGELADSESFQKLVENIWAKTKSAYIRNFKQVEENIDTDAPLEFQDGIRNIISVPNQCPEGYKADALGICRKQL